MSAAGVDLTNFFKGWGRSRGFRRLGYLERGGGGSVLSKDAVLPMDEEERQIATQHWTCAFFYFPGFINGLGLVSFTEMGKKPLLD